MHKIKSTMGLDRIRQESADKFISFLLFLSGFFCRIVSLLFTIGRGKRREAPPPNLCA